MIISTNGRGGFGFKVADASSPNGFRVVGNYPTFGDAYTIAQLNGFGLPPELQQQATTSDDPFESEIGDHLEEAL